MRTYEERQAERKQRKIEKKKAFTARLNADDLLKPGTPATVHSGSDSYPYEVVSATYFKSGKKAGLVKTVELRSLDYVRTDKNGMSECQSYEYTSNEENGIESFKVVWDSNNIVRFIASGTYRSCGQLVALRPVCLGYARKYWDPSF